MGTISFLDRLKEPAEVGAGAVDTVGNPILNRQACLKACQEAMHRGKDPPQGPTIRTVMGRSAGLGTPFPPVFYHQRPSLKTPKLPIFSLSPGGTSLPPPGRKKVRF